MGVYDPATGALQVVEARKAVLRATLRSAADGELGTEDDAPKTVSGIGLIILRILTLVSRHSLHVLSWDKHLEPRSRKSPFDH